jgi:hypothetical protein
VASSNFQLPIIRTHRTLRKFWPRTLLGSALSFCNHLSHARLTFLLFRFVRQGQPLYSSPVKRTKRADKQKERVAGMLSDIRQTNADNLSALRQKLKQQKMATRRQKVVATPVVASSSSSSSPTTATTANLNSAKEEDESPPRPVDSPPYSSTTTQHDQRTNNRSSSSTRRFNLWNHQNCFR